MSCTSTLCSWERLSSGIIDSTKARKVDLLVELNCDLFQFFGGSYFWEMSKFIGVLHVLSCLYTTSMILNDTY